MTWPTRPLDGPHETTYRSAVFCLLYISEKLPNAFAHILADAFLFQFGHLCFDWPNEWTLKIYHHLQSKIRD